MRQRKKEKKKGKKRDILPIVISGAVPCRAVLVIDVPGFALVTFAWRKRSLWVTDLLLLLLLSILFVVIVVVIIILIIIRVFPIFAQRCSRARFERITNVTV